MTGSDLIQTALLQTPLHWESPSDNVRIVGEKIALLTEGIDLIALPEMFSTGFTMSPNGLAEPNEGETISRLRGISAERQLAICGSFIAVENGKYYNRFFWINGGELERTYDKRHLFRMAEENKVYSPGVGDARIKFKGWNIMPRVCYDLRFPVWSRSNDVDLQIYVANWPRPRTAAWDKLLLARAIENQCYVIGVNRTGEDGNGIPYSGHSIAIDPKGDPMTEVGNERDEWVMATLDLKALNLFREKFPVGLDADQFEIKP